MNCSPLVLAMMIIINFPRTCSPGRLAELRRAPPPGPGNSSRTSLISDIARVWRLNTLMRIKSLRFHHLSPFSPRNSSFCICSFTPPRCVYRGVLFCFISGRELLGSDPCVFSARPLLSGPGFCWHFWAIYADKKDKPVWRKAAWRCCTFFVLNNWLRFMEINKMAITSCINLGKWFILFIFIFFNYVKTIPKIFKM